MDIEKYGFVRVRGAVGGSGDVFLHDAVGVWDGWCEDGNGSIRAVLDISGVSKLPNIERPDPGVSRFPGVDLGIGCDYNNG